MRFFLGYGMSVFDQHTLRYDACFTLNLGLGFPPYRFKQPLVYPLQPSIQLQAFYSLLPRVSSPKHQKRSGLTFDVMLLKDNRKRYTDLD